MTTQKSHKKENPAIKSRRFLKLIFMIILTGIFLVGGSIFGYVAALVKDEPVRSREEIQSNVFKNNLTGFAYFSNKDQNNSNELIGMLRADEDRRFVQYNEIPQYVIDAFVAIEDRNFWNHYGINVKALTRAVLQQVLNSDVQTGGSTITQQLAKYTFYSFDKTHQRKAKEIFLALRMERFLSKEEIFTAYINKIHFGKAANLNNVYGIQAAAKGYFNKDAKDLNLAESTFLAGIPQRPTAYSSFDNQGFDEEGYELAKKRQELVLREMLEEKFISQQEYDEAMVYDIQAAFDTSQKKAYSKYPFLMLEIENRAAEKLVEAQGIPQDSKEYGLAVENAKQELLTGGYKVYATIDKEIYTAMNDVAKNPKNFNKPIDYNFKLSSGKVKEIKGALEQVGATLIHNKTGAILGFVGGRDFDVIQINHSNFRGTTKRQPGSSIKPLLDYGPAIELGLIQPATPIDDIPLGGKWEPENWNHKYNGRLTARTALNWSYNIPAVRVFKMVGQEKGYEFFTNLGFHANEKWFMQAGLTPAIGTIETSPEQMTNAYTTFANGGTYIDAYLIQRIEDKDGNVVFEHESTPHVVFSEQTSYLITDMLRTVIKDGTAKTILQYIGNRDVAGKTGTTNDSKDLWFMGYTPEITLGVWVGYDDPHKIYDGNIAKNIWGKMFSGVLKVNTDLSPSDLTFERPDGLLRMEVSSTSGKLPSELTKEAGYLVTDWFNKKDIPTEVDDSLEKARIVTFNGARYLAKPETPDDMVQNEIFFKREPYVVPAGKEPPVDRDKELPQNVDPRTSKGEPPAPPSSPVIKMQGSKNILSWDKNTSEEIVGYRIYRASSFGIGFNKIGVIQQTNTEPGRYYFEDLNADSSHVYYITAVDVVNQESSPSSYVGNTNHLFNPPGEEQNHSDDQINDPSSGNTDDPNNDQGNQNNTVNSVPSQPKNVHAKVGSSGLQVTITWSDNPSGEKVTKYNIYYSSTENGEYELIGSSSGSSFSHLSVPIGKAYYRVTAVNELGESISSKPVEVNR